MKKILDEIIFGKNRAVSGAIALSMIAFIALGCFCNKDFKLPQGGESNVKTKKTPAASADNSDDTDNTTVAGSPDEESTPAAVTTKANASKGELPGDEEMNQMVQQALLDFNEAVQTEDFTNFRNGVSKPFRSQYTAEQFKTAFSTFITQKTAMNGVLTSIDGMKPEYTTPPEVGKESGTRVLKVAGSYQTYPGMKFDLKYIPEKTDWKLIRFEVRVGVE